MELIRRKKLALAAVKGAKTTCQKGSGMVN